MTKEKLWSLISQNEPSLVPLSMVELFSPFFMCIILESFFFLHSSFNPVDLLLQASKLSAEDCIVAVDLLEVFLVEHQCRLDFLP